MPAPSNDREDPRVPLLEAQLGRRTSALAQIQTTIKRFVTLSLTERATICAALLPSVCDIITVDHGAILMCGPEDVLEIAAQRGLDPSIDSPALTAAGHPLWPWVLAQRSAVMLDAAAVGERWPAAPQAFVDGLAAASVTIQDRPIGLIVIARKRSGELLDDLDLELLATLAGLAALFIANSDAYQAQQMLLAELEWQADSAQRALQELDAQLALVDQQRREIRQLSTPILAVWSRVLVLPVIGEIDSRRCNDMMERLLGEVVRRQARFTIIDITGVDRVDAETANHLIKMTRAAALLGSRCLLTGIRPAVAQTLIATGIDLSSVLTMADLRRGLDYCIAQLGPSTPNRSAL
jgi:anti-anti-sigma regulatory factor